MGPKEHAEQKALGFMAIWGSFFLFPFLFGGSVKNHLRALILLSAQGASDQRHSSHSSIQHNTAHSAALCYKMAFSCTVPPPQRIKAYPTSPCFLAQLTAGH
jgi:hypothetical protein